MGRRDAEDAEETARKLNVEVEPVSDLADAAKPGRESPAERTICINLGLALDDMATAPLVYNRAVDLGLGRQLPL